MYVEFNRRWRTLMPGMKTQLGGGVAEILIKRGICREVKPEKKDAPRRSTSRPASFEELIGSDRDDD